MRSGPSPLLIDDEKRNDWQLRGHVMILEPSSEIVTCPLNCLMNMLQSEVLG
jgi:hypothetical protein